MATKAKVEPERRTMQTGYVMKPSVVRRLRMHSAATNMPACQILERLIDRHLPKYGEQ